MSAVIALGTIGVAAYDALAAAIVIGAGSMLAMAVVSAVSLPNLAMRAPAEERQAAHAIDYARALSWIVPVAAAVFVLFQIHVPVGSSLVNVNLADPIAILGGGLVVLGAIRHRHLPRWRVNHVNASVAAATLVLALSLVIGGLRFGWTDWALINRFFGWFVLLAFGATGALAVWEGGKDAFRILLLTYAGATASIALLEAGLVVVRGLGFWLPPDLIDPGNAMAFAQNRNAFAFQLLMGMAATLVMVRRNNLRIVLLTAILAGFWFTGSRSGWIAAACVCAAALYFKSVTFRQIGTAAICAGCIAAVVATLPTFHAYELLTGHRAAPWDSFFAPPIVPNESSTHERLFSIVGGLKLFAAHPIFGAGLGAFRNETMLGAGAVPLLIHSSPVWLLAELGLVGFVIFAVPAIYVLKREWLSARQSQASAVVALCFVAMAVMSGPADMIYQRTFWLLIGAALAIPRDWARAD